ncbi:DUF1190 domain-containing protein [Paenirhodobacter sp.]|uniref:DUF1190 domain-containing protein n=1 Tax=Paenirhodobacter sp. TaxID=1965326 RepID=UPI003B3C0FE7
MKRSRTMRPLTIGLIGASAFALAACKTEAQTEQATAFPDLKSCLAESARPGATVTEDECTTAYAQAMQTNMESAPRYDAMASCEEQHGVGNCQAQVSEGGGGMGSIFMPLLTGFLLGKMMSGGGLMSQPLYPQKNGGFATPGGQAFSNNRGASTVPTSTFNKPATTFDKAPMSSKPTTGWNSKSPVKSTGGFGSSAVGSGG